MPSVGLAGSAQAHRRLVQWGPSGPRPASERDVSAGPAATSRGQKNFALGQNASKTASLSQGSSAGQAASSQVEELQEAGEGTSVVEVVTQANLPH